MIDIEYEFNYISLSSSKKDEDNASDFDRYESNLIKQDEWSEDDWLHCIGIYNANFFNCWEFLEEDNQQPSLIV